jgi:hypothetical protein
MNYTNILSAAAVLVAHIFAIVALLLRYRQIRHPGMIGMLVGLLIITVAYGLFTYNAIVGQSNAPLAYFLRLGNGLEAFTMGMFLLANYRATRHIQSKAKGGD